MSKNKNSLVVITGASEGIGFALSNELLKIGFQVVGISSNKNKILKMKKKLNHFGKKFTGITTDVRNLQDLQQIANKFDGPDLLILNAGIYSPVYCENPDIEIFKKHNEVNYLGVINAYIAFLKKMLIKKKGIIVIMSSISGWLGLPKAAAYGPTKAALRSFSQSARYDLEKYGIKIKLCSPGFVNTPATSQNKFYMPGLLEPDVAAKIIIKNLETRKFEISFPFVFSYFMKFLSILPDMISYKIISSVTKKNDK